MGFLVAFSEVNPLFNCKVQCVPVSILFGTYLINLLMETIKNLLYDFLINKFLNCTPVHYVSYLSLMWFLANHLSSFRISHLFSVLLTGLQVFHIVPPATNLNCFQVPHSRLPHHSRYSPLRLSCFLFYSISSVDGITIT